jgi:hypothetical protein
MLVYALFMLYLCLFMRVFALALSANSITTKRHQISASLAGTTPACSLTRSAFPAIFSAAADDRDAWHHAIRTEVAETTSANINFPQGT